MNTTDKLPPQNLEDIARRMEGRLDRFEAKILSLVEHGFAAVNQRLDAVERRLGNVEQRLHFIERKIERFEARMDDVLVQVVEFKDRVRRIEERLTEQPIA
jgi:predicted component of type VI protein secretion system